MARNKLTGKDGNTFSAENQPKRKRGKSLLTLLKKKIYDENSTMIFKNVLEIDDNGDETGNKVNVKIKINNADSLVLHALRRLPKNDRMLIWLMEQEDGKALQKIQDVTERQPIKIITSKPEDFKKDILK